MRPWFHFSTFIFYFYFTCATSSASGTLKRDEPPRPVRSSPITGSWRTLTKAAGKRPNTFKRDVIDDEHWQKPPETLSYEEEDTCHMRRRIHVNIDKSRRKMSVIYKLSYIYRSYIVYLLYKATYMGLLGNWRLSCGHGKPLGCGRCSGDG
jgi:hypothetical protein